MQYVMFTSYGNDSIALMQWAHERGLRDVHTAYSDTGWAAPWWPARVEQAEAWARSLGFTPHRIASEGMEALVARKKAWPQLLRSSEEEISLTSGAAYVYLPKTVEVLSCSVGVEPNL